MKLDDAKSLVGELILTGFEGTSLSDDTSAFLSQASIGGVLLFAKNYENPEQLISLTQELDHCRTGQMWISVDQEGGKVQRFKKGFTVIPTAEVLSSQGSPRDVFAVSEMMAKELKAAGINLNFAPVADINTNPSNPVIGDRAFGRTQDEVTKFVSAFVRGHITQHVQPCVKHFPGHGDTSEDSHFKLPQVNTPLETLKQREFQPFIKAFKSRCSFVMTAHILNQLIDADFPATFSQKTLKTILRDDLRYSKIIVSDDLEMKAVTDHFGAKEAPVMAINAGCDLLIYRTEDAARKGYESLLKALEDGKLSLKRVSESFKRLQDLKKEVLTKPTESPHWKQVIGCEEHQKLIEKFKN